jgi:hypothetical protein
VSPARIFSDEGHSTGQRTAGGRERPDTASADAAKAAASGDAEAQRRHRAGHRREQPRSGTLTKNEESSQMPKAGKPITIPARRLETESGKGSSHEEPDSKPSAFAAAGFAAASLIANGRMTGVRRRTGAATRSENWGRTKAVRRPTSLRPKAVPQRASNKASDW